MKVRKEKEKTIVEVDPGELLDARVRVGKRFSDAIRFSVWELLSTHNVMDGRPQAFSEIAYVDGKYLVTVLGTDHGDALVREAVRVDPTRDKNE